MNEWLNKRFKEYLLVVIEASAMYRVIIFKNKVMTYVLGGILAVNWTPTHLFLTMQVETLHHTESSGDAQETQARDYELKFVEN